jgi:hypothetical protein
LARVGLVLSLLAWVPVAVKYVEKRKVITLDVLDNHRVPRDLKLLQQIQRVRGVIRFLDFYEDRDHVVLIMEKSFCCKDLFEVIKMHWRKRLLVITSSRLYQL